MTMRRLILVGLAAGAVLASAPVRAHHSIQLQYDISKTGTITGAINKMEWKNPHAWLYVDVKNAAGRIESWAIEFGSSNALIRRGWRREDLPVGAQITITGYVPRDGSKSLGATDVKLADGRTLFAGNAPTEGGR